jgi:hypothetical protein
MAYSYTNFQNIADAPSNYYWTVVTKEEIGDGGSSPESGYVAIAAASKRVNKDREVKYYIRAWKLVDGIPQALNDEVVEVLIPTSYRTEVADKLTIGSIISTNDDSTLFGDKNLFIVGFQSKVDNYTFTPRFLVQLKPNTVDNNTSNPLEVLPQNGINGIPRTITFTKGNVDSEIPQNILDEAAIASLQGLITKDRCATPNTWVALIRKNKDDGAYYFVKTYSLNGTFLHQKLIGKDALGRGPGPDKIDHYEIGRKQLLALKAKDCFGDETPALPDTSILPPPNLDKVRYNPPNHFVTRSIAHGERTRDQLNSSNRFITSISDAQAALANRNNRLGKIYQSTDGAKALNKKDKTGKRPLWGFKFTYNPTTLEYGTTTNTSIDWMLNSKDPANLLGGNTEVKVSLYLNRIVDMTELKNWRGGAYTQNYPRALLPEEVEGILKRGTEYDLEYLYRVLNGSPGKTALLSYPGETSDFGYITGTPCWFHLHDNLRYYGSMSALSVSHVMFTQEMVPMLSKVDVSFIRYPSLDLSPADVKKAYQEQASKVATTGEEPATS